MAGIMGAHLIDREVARIFRITHVDNVPWILAHGLHCQGAPQRDPGYVAIGNPDLIDRRTRRAVPVPPGGTLSDYVPFYFTPWSPMLFNIKTGRGVPMRPMSEIAILVSSIPRLEGLGIRYLVSDRHAYLQLAEFATGPAGLDRIDWQQLRKRNFQRDPEDPTPFDRYQAEALVHQHLPCEGLLAVICHGEEQAERCRGPLRGQGQGPKLLVKPDLFF